MTLANLYSILNGITGFSGKVAYRAFPEGNAPALPFIVYLVTGTNNFAADNIVTHVQTEIDIELYCQKKDPATEALIESALTTNDIYWEKTEEYISDEDIVEIIYTIEV